MPPSPKVHKAKSPEPNVPLYGCGEFPSTPILMRGHSLTAWIEHIQRLLTKSPEVTTNTIQHYKMLLRVIFDKTPVIPQTTKSIDKRPVTTLKPNFLCLQCPTTCTAQDRHRHGELKAHMFCKKVIRHSRHLTDIIRCGFSKWRTSMPDVWWFYLGSNPGRAEAS